MILFVIARNCCAVDKTTTAILDLQATGVSQTEAISLSNMIRHEIFMTGTHKVLERESMEEIAKEQGFQLAGCTSSECAVEAGKILGVQRMVAGSIDKVGNMYIINLRMIDVQSGEITAMASTHSQRSIEEVVINSTKEVVRNLVGEKTSPRPIGRKGSNFYFALGSTFKYAQFRSVVCGMGILKRSSEKSYWKAELGIDIPTGGQFYYDNHNYSNNYSVDNYWDIGNDGTQLYLMVSQRRYIKSALYYQIPVYITFKRYNIDEIKNYSDHINWENSYHNDDESKQSGFVFGISPGIGLHISRGNPFSIDFALGFILANYNEIEMEYFPNQRVNNWGLYVSSNLNWQL